MKPVDHKIYLASKSPRRRELLRQIGVDFELLLPREKAPRGPDVSEEVHPDEAPRAYVERVTREKA
ncbi:MAG: septum formation inhibitor Maf, partial [Paucimonas sp.]|nr:septum formation inhibitor Maf [Paucimonas sp.]